MDELLRDNVGEIRLTIRDAANALVDPDGNALTVTIVDSAGAELGGSPYTAARVTQGIYKVTIDDGDTAVLDDFHATWVGTVGGQGAKFRTRYRTVGGFLFGVEDLRDEYPEELDDETTYTVDKIRRARLKAIDRLSELMGVALVPRGSRVRLDGTGSPKLLLPHIEVQRVVSVTIGDTALSVDELAALKVTNYGLIERPNGIWPEGDQNIEVLDEHGLDPAPEPVRDAAMRLALAYLVRSPVPDRAMSESTDVGTVRYSVAGRDGPTGIPEVDAVIDQYRLGERRAG